MTRFDDLCRRLNAQPDRRGECYVPCVFCGKDQGARRPSHFSFSERGYSCFTCGASGSLFQLARHLGLTDDRPVLAMPPPKPKPQRDAPWKAAPARYLATVTANPDRITTWRRYKPVNAETVYRYQLGVGPLPPLAYDGCGRPLYAARCGHDRLIVPVFAGGKVVAIRGRALDCDCPKWLTASGSVAALFNGDALRPGCSVVIAENMIDALLYQQRYPDRVAVASTAGAGTWRAEWTAAIAAVRPKGALVCLDNDLVGGPNGETYRRLATAWRAAHPQAPRVPEPNAPRIAAELSQAGVLARLHIWPAGTPAKADLGDYLARVAS